MTAPTSPTTPAAPTTSLWEDFVDIFYAPAQVFARRREGRFGLALLVLTIAMTALFVATKPVMAPAMDAEFDRGMAQVKAKNPQITDEQLSKGKEIQDKFGVIIFPIIWPITVMVIGLVLWLTGKMVDARESLAPALMVATYSQYPRILGYVGSAVQAYTMDPATIDGVARLSFSPARFMDPATTSGLMRAVAGRFDLFTIWATVLLAIGLAVVANIPRQRAAIAAFLVWLLGMLPAISQGMRTG